MRGILFAKRVSKELLRDPMSYIFCLVTPLAMLLLFFLIYSNIPAEGQANMQIFSPVQLSPGIAYFGFTFVMLFATLLISRDRGGAFLMRLYASPMTAPDFLLGYFLPLFVLGLLQCLLTFLCGAILGAISGAALTFIGCLRATAALLPALLFFIGCGMIFGALLSEVASPGVSSVLITLSGVMGGVWIPLSDIPKLERIFNVFPFLHMVRLARSAMTGEADNTWLHLVVSLLYAALACVLAIASFRFMQKREAR
jgi:ABC-2 type transport system permease protein